MYTKRPWFLTETGVECFPFAWRLLEVSVTGTACLLEVDVLPLLDFVHDAEFTGGDTDGVLNLAVQRAHGAKTGIVGNGFDAVGGMVAQQAQGSHQAQEARSGRWSSSCIVR